MRTPRRHHGHRPHGRAGLSGRRYNDALSTARMRIRTTGPAQRSDALVKGWGRRSRSPRVINGRKQPVMDGRELTVRTPGWAGEADPAADGVTDSVAIASNKPFSDWTKTFTGPGSARRSPAATGRARPTRCAGCPDRPTSHTRRREYRLFPRGGRRAPDRRRGPSRSTATAPTSTGPERHRHPIRLDGCTSQPAGHPLDAAPQASAGHGWTSCSCSRSNRACPGAGREAGAFRR
jgi:hypothetical protein